jgi:acetoin utilization protein AcuB
MVTVDEEAQMLETTRVEDIMTHRVVVLSEEDNLSHVAEGLERLSFHHLPVLDGTKVVGMVSQRDLLRTTLTGLDRSMPARNREARFLEQLFVRDVMHTDILSARPDEPVSSAARRMLESKVGALPVVDDAGNLLGIVTQNDVLRLVAGQPAALPA